jgi:hypothetical protein
LPIIGPAWGRDTGNVQTSDRGPGCATKLPANSPIKQTDKQMKRGIDRRFLPEKDPGPVSLPPGQTRHPGFDVIHPMSIVTATVLRYAPAGRFRALSNMGVFFIRPFRTEGLRFQKLLGSGIDFGMVPDLSTYVFLGVWDTETNAHKFLQSTDFQKFIGTVTHTGTLWLSPLKSHGLWDGQDPFGADGKASIRPGVSMNDEQAPQNNSSFIVHRSSLTAVLTRATIRPRALPDFWRHVPQTRDRLRAQPDLLFGIGVGELPLIQQCTISVWRTAQAVDQYAYRQPGHREIVRLTRQRNWYSEELFARFAVLNADGCLKSLVDGAENDASKRVINPE